MVELAICLLFLVPILVYSFYATDVFMNRLKAEEITANAAWELTGRLLHDYDNPSNNAGTSLITSKSSAVQTDIEHLYGVGLDAWKRVSSGSTSTTNNLVFAGLAAYGTLSSLSCGPSSASVANGSNPTVAGINLGSMLGPFVTGGLVQCQAQIDVSNSWLGQGTPAFLDGDFGHVKLYNPSASKIPMCGVGTARSGTCTNAGSFTLYVDDWALSQDGNDAHTQYPDGNTSSDNPHLFNMGQAVYQLSYGSGVTGSGIAAAGPTVELGLITALMAKDGLTEQYEIPIAVLPDLDYAQFMVSYHGETSGEGPSNSDDTNLVNTEGGNQPNDTWPYANGAVGSIAANAYQTAFSARSATTYLGITAAE